MLSIPDPHGPDRVRPPYDAMYTGLSYTAPGTYNKPDEGVPSWAQKSDNAGIDQAQLPAHGAYDEQNQDALDSEPAPNHVEQHGRTGGVGYFAATGIHHIGTGSSAFPLHETSPFIDQLARAADTISLASD